MAEQEQTKFSIADGLGIDMNKSLCEVVAQYKSRSQNARENNMRFNVKLAGLDEIGLYVPDDENVRRRFLEEALNRHHAFRTNTGYQMVQSESYTPLEEMIAQIAMSMNRIGEKHRNNAEKMLKEFNYFTKTGELKKMWSPRGTGAVAIVSGLALGGYLQAVTNNPYISIPTAVATSYALEKAFQAMNDQKEEWNYEALGNELEHLKSHVSKDVLAIMHSVYKAKLRQRQTCGSRDGSGW